MSTRRQRIRENMRQARLRSRLEKQLRKNLASEFRRWIGELTPTNVDSSEIEIGLSDGIESMLEKNYKRIFAVMVRDTFADNAKGMRLAFERKTEDIDQGTLVQKLWRKFTKKFALKKAKAISKTSTEIAKKIVTRALEDELSYAEISRELRKRLPGIAKRKADTIARTEAHSAANNAQLGTQKELAEVVGLKQKKVWSASLDDRTREDHLAADGQKKDMDKPFIVGGVALDYPGDPDGPPEQTINCRCVMLFE